MTQTISRRQILKLSAAIATSAAAGRVAFAADPIRIAVFITLSGGASLFGASSRAAADYAAAQINASGGIMGRPLELTIADGGAAPAEVAKTATRMVIGKSVDIIVGSHDSAVRQAIEAAIRGKVPYIYTPVFEGGDCAPFTYFLGETPEQQVGASIESLVKRAGGKSFYLIGNDYVWPRATNDAVKAAVKRLGGTIVGEEYYPVGAANKFESSIEKIRAASPAIVLQTLVGGDNVNFNRTFANFGLSANILRMSCLLEENTLLGIGKEASDNLYSCMGYFAKLDLPENKAFIAGIAKTSSGTPAIQNTIAKSVYDGLAMAKAVVEKAKSVSAKDFDAAAEHTSFNTPSGMMTVKNRHTAKIMYLAKCSGTDFEVIETFKDIQTGQSCN
ncbi:substrate-binding domain-containing protein [Agrobacterium rhizogenes]|uniref:Nitrile hydratase regulator n=1 Tax=Rhizobium rhizogenes (strain K84 / ATCC BAA-868) TaxID=311403 RepID=B9JQ62_RHIR8|nr:substrate-binding domain-containing protein [Rhizobium rhizogenes]ACM31281.1 nitrile hydratase regulator [Rhizobium rhizogenes K84]NTI46236.1 substrate-binding domain-containing protein [Rhizobium rhizogenes]NTI52919.1 substrate-binding domain-containing protein [Rhizobium rhizogenes]NTI98292.1 substrate-binding domain-containing protein [Rhizobium rhizogenes]NTJ60721.1 substrate-binding domain-containing protein [Rhizobium rhizogenes]